MEAQLIIEGYVGGHGDCNVYRLLPDDGCLSVSVFSGDYPNCGVEVFECDATGWIASMDTIFQTYETMDHASALARIGHEVVA